MHEMEIDYMEDYTH